MTEGNETVDVTLTPNTSVTVATSPNNAARVTIVGP
jgi:hypothetical protein